MKQSFIQLERIKHSFNPNLRLKEKSACMYALNLLLFEGSPLLAYNPTVFTEKGMGDI